MEYDGCFYYNSKRIDYLITDGPSMHTAAGKMYRGIQFYAKDDKTRYISIYGTDEEMTNISPIDAKKWYVKKIVGK